jgi:hypothetical protein
MYQREREREREREIEQINHYKPRTGLSKQRERKTNGRISYG